MTYQFELVKPLVRA